MSWIPLPGQSVDYPLKEWKKKLSVKTDLVQNHFMEVYNAILQYDSMHQCIALNKLNELVKNANTRFRLRVHLLSYMYALQTSHCIDKKTPDIQVLEDDLRIAYEFEDDLLAAQINDALSWAYELNSELGHAIMYKTFAKEIREKEGYHKFRQNSMLFHFLGNLLYRSRDYEGAVKAELAAIHFRGDTPETESDTLDDYWAMNAWNNLGLAYKKLEVYDSAFLALNQASKIANRRTFDPFWSGLIQGNRGDVFFLLQQYDSAEALLQIDYEKSLHEPGELGNASLTLARLAQIANVRGEHQKALQLMKDAKALADRAPNDYFIAEIYDGLGSIFKNLHMADSSYHYMQKYIELHDRLEKAADQNRGEIVRLRMANQDSIHKLLSLGKDKRRVSLIRNFSIALIIVLTALGFLYINRIKLKSRIRQQEAIEKQRLAEADAQKAKEQLEAFTESMVEKTKLVENLQSKLMERELTEEQVSQIQELSHFSILTDEDWDRFKSMFTTVYPSFFLDLRHQVNDITLAEQRMAALIKLQVSNKDAATMLGISVNSIHKTRQRLRQRLGFDDDGALENYLIGVVPK